MWDEDHTGGDGRLVRGRPWARCQVKMGAWLGIGQGACREDCRAEHCRSRLHELIDADLLEGGDGEGVLVGVRVTVRVRVRVGVGVRVRVRARVRVRVKVTVRVRVTGVGGSAASSTR